MPPSTADAGLEKIGAWLNLQQVTRVIQGLLEERLQVETGLSWAEFELLLRLGTAADGPLRMSELANRLMASPSGVTRIAERLERAGLIVRETPRENRRIVRARVTAPGREVTQRARSVFEAALADVFSDHLSPAEVPALRLVLRKLLERNDAWKDARCDPGFGDRADPPPARDLRRAGRTPSPASPGRHRARPG